MAKRVLVIGGTYFAGRVFTMLSAKDMDLCFLNRGRYSMRAFGENIEEYKADRTDENSLKACPVSGYFDAVVDFCAYEPGDIKRISDCLPVEFGKYIYFSTADVYRRENSVKTEESPRMEIAPDAADTEHMYAYKKKLLEDELMDIAGRKGFSYVILRPAFIYGPYNYAPRESLYIRGLLRQETILRPVDAKGRFQMVYVKDVALAVKACIEKAEDRCYNLSAPEVLDYDQFLSLMENVSGIRAEHVADVTVDEVIRNNYPLPFPLTEEESELFDGSLITKELGVAYTPIAAGMEKTFNAFRPVYAR